MSPFPNYSRYKNSGKGGTSELTESPNFLRTNEDLHWIPFSDRGESRYHCNSELYCRGAWKEDDPTICETLCGLKLMT